MRVVYALRHDGEALHGTLTVDGVHAAVMAFPTDRMCPAEPLAEEVPPMVIPALRSTTSEPIGLPCVGSTATMLDKDRTGRLSAVPHDF